MSNILHIYRALPTNFMINADIKDTKTSAAEADIHFTFFFFFFFFSTGIDMIQQHTKQEDKSQHSQGSFQRGE